LLILDNYLMRLDYSTLTTVDNRARREPVLRRLVQMQTLAQSATPRGKGFPELRPRVTMRAGVPQGESKWIFSSGGWW
jgi:hypothetical protein